MTTFIGLCHKCYASNCTTELIEGATLCLKCRVVDELKHDQNIPHLKDD